MTRQHVQRTQKSPQNDDSWILQRVAVRQLPAKAKTPQVQRESQASDKPRIKLDLTRIPVSSHDRPVVRPPLMVGKARETSGQHSLPAKPELRNGWESPRANLAIHNWEGDQGMPVQAKLAIGQPHDKYEQEAERVASQVVQQINAPASTRSTQGQSVQRQSERSEEEGQALPEITSLQGREEPTRKVQTKLTLQGADAIASGEASSELTSAINSARGGGQPLDAGLQQSMGQAMGADFSGVRVHTDAQSDRLNQSIQAKAFTTGEDVFFRQGEYQPGTRGGQETIAHELTHVVQQMQGQVKPKMQTKEGAINKGNVLENEADVTGASACHMKSSEKSAFEVSTNSTIQRSISNEEEKSLRDSFDKELEKAPKTLRAAFDEEFAIASISFYTKEEAENFLRDQLKKLKTIQGYFDNPKSIWGKSHEDLWKDLKLVNWEKKEYKGTSEAFEYIRELPGSRGSIVINYGGGRHTHSMGKATFAKPFYYKLEWKPDYKIKVIDSKTYPEADKKKEKYTFVEM